MIKEGKSKDMSTQTILTQQEIKEKTQEYKKILSEFKQGLELTKRTWKQEIIKMAKALEGTMPDNRISRRIILDLRPYIFEGIISINPIMNALEPRFKIRGRGRKKRGVIKHTIITKGKPVNLALELLEVVSGFSSRDAYQMDRGELVSKTKEHRRNMMTAWMDDEVYMMANALNALVPLLRDELDMVSTAALSRKKNAEMSGI